MPTARYNLLLWISFLGISVAFAFPEQYGDCIKFCNADQVLKSSDLETICIEDKAWNCTYCMYYPKTCPEPVACDYAPPVRTPDGRCIVCPGEECIYNGDAHKVGDTFSSLDNINMCSCNADGRVSCSKYPIPPHRIFCGI
ncbi:uncharacterized protein LOC117317262 [Pecten maximus]|uniref:uncharacterized protein LOC117317262 n=1 Tax=Pecten maximus TaxID=6579 RepID=UPI001458963A|nr:uncharacterized protein LOC117317262 [Pecten maximus]XP_033727889.1 uncharacterized protein LOC117317262 [Pecten maximus]